MSRITNILMVYLSMLFGIALLLSYLSVYVSPTTFWIIGLVGLAYPFLLLANLTMLIYWIVKWRGEFLIPFIAIVLGVSHLSNFIQLPFGKIQQADGKNLTVLTYNVNFFQLFHWAEEPPAHNQIFTFINEQNPDIVALQEFYVEENKFTQEQATDKLRYHAHIGYSVERQSSGYGLATFSRYPIVGKGELSFNNTANSCIYTDIAMGTDTIRVYNSHLQSIRLKEQNLRFLLGQGARDDNVTNLDEIKDISFRYRYAITKRAEQVEMLTNHILSSPYPVILCGDFNDSPISYSYHQLRRKLNDSFVDAGVGVGYTYRGLSLSFRIDYILYSPHFRAVMHSVPQITYSDHYPVVATLRIQGEKESE